MLQNNIPFLYNPSKYSDNELKSNFVIRLKEFELLIKNIESDEMLAPPQHFLIIGQRGYGKTTLLLRLKIELKNNNKLSKRFVPVLFEEEQYGIASLANLWEEALRKLSYEDDIFNLHDHFIDKLYEGNSPEESIFNLLISQLKKHNKKIILLIDNFDYIINKFKTKDIQRFREVLITSSEIKLFAASSIMLESFYRYHEPFYEFFRNIILKALEKDETILLLKRLGETSNTDKTNKVINEQPERIEALRRLTGGVPRTIILLFEIFLDDPSGNSFHDLEILLDRVTPLYKDRMDNLFPQQQSIVDALAQNWDAMGVSEISVITRLQSKTVSSQLNLLVKNQIVEKIKTSNKNHLYLIKERFFNIYYLMRHGNKNDRNRVLWLVKFFEAWLNPKELIDRSLKHIDEMRKDNLDREYAYTVSSALIGTNIPLIDKMRLRQETLEYLRRKGSDFQNDFNDTAFSINKEIDISIRKKDEHRDLDIKIPTSVKIEHGVDKERKDFREMTDEIYNEALVDIRNKHITTAYTRLINSGYSESVANLTIGSILHFELKLFSESIQYYEKAAADGNIKAMSNLAVLYHMKFNDIVKAENYYKRAAETDDLPALNNLALFYEDIYKNYKKAEEYYIKAIKRSPIPAAYNLAQLYENNLNDFRNAEKYYLMAIDNGTVEAMFSIALLYHFRIKDLRKAEEYYIKASEKGFASAMFNLALFYQTVKKDFAKAIDYYLKASAENHIFAMINLSSLYQDEFRDYKKSEKYLLKASSLGNASAMYNLAILYQRNLKDAKKAEEYFLKASENNYPGALNSLALIYQNEFHDLDKARVFYEKAIKKEDIDAMNNLALLNFYLKKNKAVTLKLYSKVIESKPDHSRKLIYAIFLAWNNEIEKSISLLDELIFSIELDKEIVNILFIIKLLLSKKQYNYVLRLFQDGRSSIKDKFKPLFFALLNLLGDEYLDEYKKMGGELKETVMEILKDIDKISIDFA